MVHATLTLRKAIWHEEAQLSKLNQALNEAAVILENEIKAYIDESDPAGHIYRLSTITGRFSARGVGNRRRGTKGRSVIGATFYRASAPGQPPAKRTGKLYSSIRVRRVGNTSIRAIVDVHYAKILDNINKLNRPFFKVVVNNFFKFRFRELVKNRLAELT